MAAKPRQTGSLAQYVPLKRIGCPFAEHFGGVCVWWGGEGRVRTQGDLLRRQIHRSFSAQAGLSCLHVSPPASQLWDIAAPSKLMPSFVCLSLAGLAVSATC